MEWRERIQAARARGHFTAQDRYDALTSFGACAVGEQADRYGAELIFHCPSNRVGVKDARLRHLGAKFGGAVSVSDYSDAERCLDQIEDRVLALKLNQWVTPSDGR